MPAKKKAKKSAAQKPLAQLLSSRLLRRLVLGGVAVGFLSASVLAYAYYAPGAHQEEVRVNIRPGSSVATIARMLRARGLIKSSFLLRFFVRLRGEGHLMQAGEFSIPPRAGLGAVITALRDGQPVLHSITIAEGLTSAQVVAVLNDSLVLQGRIKATPREGSLLPETYSVPRGTSRQALIAQMQAAMRAELDAAWEARRPNLPLRTKREALILASIIEKETGLPDERRDVAAVFINRLKRGMKLQSDPTIIYGLVGGRGKLGRGIRKSEILKPTPYNTYVIKGLPQGAIANPGRAAIAATLNPSDSTAIFFVADGTGGHVFADTLSAHNRNVRKWRQIEKQRKQP